MATRVLVFLVLLLLVTQEVLTNVGGNRACENTAYSPETSTSVFMTEETASSTA